MREIAGYYYCQISFNGVRTLYFVGSNTGGVSGIIHLIKAQNYNEYFLPSDTYTLMYVSEVKKC